MRRRPRHLGLGQVSAASVRSGPRSGGICPRCRPYLGPAPVRATTNRRISDCTVSAKVGPGRAGRFQLGWIPGLPLRAHGRGTWPRFRWPGLGRVQGGAGQGRGAGWQQMISDQAIGIQGSS